MITVIIIVGIALTIAISLILLYNGMVNGKNMVDEAWSGIGVQLKRRHDLIPSLVSAVKGYMTHEQDTLTKIAELRAQAVSASSSGSLSSIANAENQLMGALRSLFAVSENASSAVATNRSSLIKISRFSNFPSSVYTSAFLMIISYLTSFRFYWETS